MEDFTYKEYTEEESRIYDRALKEILGELSKGASFDEACRSVEVADAQLKSFIVDDALKVVIAEMHYKGGMPLERLADTLKLGIERLSLANREMIEDIETMSSEVYRARTFGGPAGNA